MTANERRMLVERFELTFGSLEERAIGARLRALVGPDVFPTSPAGELAGSCLKKLRDGDEPGPTPNEYAALEYMIRAMRPAPLIKAGNVDTSIDPDFLRAFPDWIGFCNEFPKWSGGVGCLFKKNEYEQFQGEGTAFLVSRNVVLTNAHVLDALSNGIRVLEKGPAIMRFRCEVGMVAPERSFDVVEVVAVHERQDACLLRIDGGYEGPALQLSKHGAENLAEIAAIGFPYRDGRNPAFVATTFGNQFGFKRVAPGVITGGQKTTGTLFHDCSTLGGNSGSPLVCMKSGDIAGIHKSGGFMWKNLAIDASVLRSWVLENADL